MNNDDKVLLIDGTGLMFIRTSTDLDYRIKSIKRDSGIKNYRLFLKQKLNNKKPINKRYEVEDDLSKKYNAEYFTDMKSEIVKIYQSDKSKYVVATLSGELFEMLDGVHFDYYYQRNKYRNCN